MAADGAAVAAVGARLGVLSIHFEGGRCRVRCPFCYLGQRDDAHDADPASMHGAIAAGGQAAFQLLTQAAARLPYRELAVTISEPEAALVESGVLLRLLRAATDRGMPAAITTTLAVASRLPAEALPGVGRLNLSVDPFKGQVHAAPGQVDPADVDATLQTCADKWPAAERVLIVSLTTPRFAEQLWDGLLASLLALPRVDRVALNALKPPPPWCDRAFWLRSLHALRPLLQQHMDRRLFLDCYVAARILGLGDCPARPDLSPAGSGAAAQVAFRGCVYQPTPDFVVGTAEDLAARLANFVVPAHCPFPIR